MSEPDGKATSEYLPLTVRVSVLEAKVRLLSIIMKWLVGGIIVVLLGYIELKL
jgi:hypothetical protein